ncbi:hypothetical protein M3F63_10190, partial [Brachybacterium muris]|nr:hypothetical protein [Brachybacterium muris]
MRRRVTGIRSAVPLAHSRRGGVALLAASVLLMGGVGTAALGAAGVGPFADRADSSGTSNTPGPATAVPSSDPETTEPPESPAAEPSETPTDPESSPAGPTTAPEQPVTESDDPGAGNDEVITDAASTEGESQRSDES